MNEIRKLLYRSRTRRMTMMMRDVGKFSVCVQDGACVIETFNILYTQTKA